MYVVTQLQQVSRNRIEQYRPEDLDPLAFQARNDLNTTLFVTVADGDSHTALHYSRLITDRTLGSLDSWEAFADNITDAVLMGYGTELPGYLPGGSTPTKQVVSWDVMSTLHTFNVGYSDYLSGILNFYPFRWNLPDLAIELQQGASPYPRLDHSIPVVNGVVCRPFYDPRKERLYAVDGAQLCWQTAATGTPEVQLLDFSEIGEVSAHNIQLHPTRPSDFKLSFTDRTRRLNPYSDWKLTCEAVSFKEYTPIVVMAGMPIWPDQYTLASEHIIQFDLGKFPWNKAMARRRYLVDEPNSQAAIHFASLSLNDYIQQQMGADTYSRECFVILVKTPNLYAVREHVDAWSNRILVDLYKQEGLLIHKPTGGIWNYHVSNYTKKKELSVQNTVALRAADAAFDGAQLSFEEPICYHFSSGFPLDLHAGQFEMLYLCG